MLFTRIGFRNLLRNKRRSFLTSLVMGFGLAAMIITDGFMEGINENMIRTITTGLTSEGQIHNEKFKETFELEDTLFNLDEVEKALQQDLNLKNYSKRVLTFSMVSSPRNMKNITLYGIEPDREINISNIHKQIIEGRFVEQENDIVLGSNLMKRLEIVLGDKVVLTAAEAKTGEVAQELFRVTGILKTGTKEMDDGLAFIHINKAQKILNLENRVHEIAMNFKSRTIAEKLTYPLWSNLSETKNIAQSWKSLLSSFVNMMSMMDISKAFVSLILMILVGLGIVNTLFMALYERMFEFSVLRSLGTKGREIIYMIVSEATGLAFLGILIGFIITALIAVPMAYYGIDYGGMEIAEVTIKEPIYYRFFWYQYLIYPALVLFFTMLVSLYPAFYAANISMSQSIKRSL